MEHVPRRGAEVGVQDQRDPDAEQRKPGRCTARVVRQGRSAQTKRCTPATLCDRPRPHRRPQNHGCHTLRHNGVHDARSPDVPDVTAPERSCAHLPVRAGRRSGPCHTTAGRRPACGLVTATVHRPRHATWSSASSTATGARSRGTSPVSSSIRSSPTAITTQIDVVTWAPTSTRRRRERGFDQAELLARARRARSSACRAAGCSFVTAPMPHADRPHT